MKKLFLATISVLVLGLSPVSVSAEVLSYAQACAGAQCTIGVGDSAAVAMELYDNQGNLAQVPATFTWTLNNLPGALLGLTPGSTVPNTTLATTSSNGFSSVYVIIPAGVVPAGGQTQGQLQVVANYGASQSTRTFTITLTCDTEPKLYTATASVTVSGTQATQSSTAELLETCRPEYKLKSNIGERQ